jgi:hypothetical protein
LLKQHWVIGNSSTLGSYPSHFDGRRSFTQPKSSLDAQSYKERKSDATCMSGCFKSRHDADFSVTELLAALHNAFFANEERIICNRGTQSVEERLTNSCLFRRRSL